MVRAGSLFLVATFVGTAIIPARSDAAQCTAMLCAPDTRCMDGPNGGRCVKVKKTAKTCALLVCDAGYYCKQYKTYAKCLKAKPQPPCGAMPPCPFGLACQKNNQGVSTCAPTPPTTPATPRPTNTAVGTISFGPNWNNSFAGELKAGGTVVIKYDPSRVQIRHTHNGFPAWGVTAFVKFNPSGELREETAIDFESVGGRPTNNPITRVITLVIPSGTKEIEIWFRNWTGADRPGEFWDSDYGKNFRYQVK